MNAICSEYFEPYTVECSNEDYHGDETALSSSVVKEAYKSGAHFWAKYEDPNRVKEEPTEPMKFGTLFHTVTLEPHKFADEYAVMPAGIDRRTTTGKNLYAEIQNRAIGKSICSEEDEADARMMAVSARNTDYGSIIGVSGIAEQTIYWCERVVVDGVEYFIRCKCRPDWSIEPGAEGLENGLIIDLKSAKDASPEGFAKAAYNLCYHIPCWWYSRGFMVFHGTTERPEFPFIAVEKEPPYIAHEHVADESFYRGGEIACCKALETYIRCKTTGIYQGYGKATQLTLPKWAKENYV